jgi:hypothetical protein
MCSLFRSGGPVLILLASVGIGAVVAATVFSTSDAHAQPADSKGGVPKIPTLKVEPPKVPTTPPLPAMPDPQAEMEKWMEINTVGAEHQALEFMAGTWDCSMSFKMTPEMPANVTKGVQTNSWTLDNRFLKTDFTGEMAPGMSFSGIAYTGYNSVRKTYEGIWLDSTTNGMMMTTGTYDASKKVINMSGEGDDMMTRKRKMFRSEYINTGADTYQLNMYDTTADGKEFVNLEIKYTRKK